MYVGDRVKLQKNFSSYSSINRDTILEIENVSLDGRILDLKVVSNPSRFYSVGFKVKVKGENFVVVESAGPQPSFKDSVAIFLDGKFLKVMHKDEMDTFLKENLSKSPTKKFQIFGAIGTASIELPPVKFETF
jgi:hypothetical protein